MTTLSIARSQKSRRPSIRQTKSQAAFEPEDSPANKPTSQWYELKYRNQNINALPSWVPTLKHSQPFRLTIERVHNIPQKKSTSSIQYLRLMVTMFTNQGEPVGKTAHYQCETPVNTSENAYNKQICFYYHSKIDKTHGKVKMLVRFVLQELREGIVESVSILGIGVIKNPFSEQDGKNTPTYKQCSQIELANGILQNPQKASLLFNFTIQSNLQLKNLIKFIPSEFIASSQDHISGISGQYLPELKDEIIEQQQIVFINVKSCQIHIPEKFQLQVLQCIRLVLPGEKIQVNQLTRRRVVCGFHNQYQYVMPVSRNLQFLGKQATGEYTVQVFQVLGDHQILKLPYYVPEKGGPNLCALAVSLIYTYSQVDYEVALFAFTPILEGPPEELSLTMVTGGGMGFETSLLPVKLIGKTPTIILQYVSEARIYTKDRLESQSSISRKQRSKKQIMQSEKMLQELQRERLSLEKQKQSLEMMKSQNYVNYQEDFQRKLIEERENLRLRQQLIENQYREEVEKQIRAKMDLENQIRLMKQRLAIIQQEQKSGMPSKKISYDQSPATEFDPGYAPSFNANYLPYARQKVNPNYLIDQQKTIPLNQVRDIVQKTFQKNTQLIQKQMKNFNFGSKFTFSFNSVIWSSSVQPPKSFYLKIKFFNFPEFTSDPITYIESSSQYNQLIRLNHYTYNVQNSTPTYEFTVDPSSFTSPQQIQQDLVNFLAKNNTIIDIFDAENYLYIGQINIKMNDLFRGSKTQTMIAKEFNLVRVKCQQNYGVLQVLVRNQMVDCKHQVSLQDKRFRREVTRKKVISNNPILLTKQIFDNEKPSETQMLGSKNQSKNRQQKRIQMFKKRATESKRKGTFDEIENNQKGRVIQKITQYKEKKMPEYIKKIYEDLLTETITINPYFGQTKTFLYQFTNMSQVPSSFRISFQGNQDNQLSLVKNPTEWKHFASTNRFPTPKLYDCINDENSFYLAAGQTIPLIFKYLSFSSSTQIQRSCTVTVTKQQNNWIIGGFSLIIQPHESITNHSYILYQPGNQTIDILLPVIFSSNDTRIPKYLFLTVEDAAAQWVHQYEIMLRVKTHQIMSFMRFHLLLYEDQYFCKLRQNWTIEMYIYQGVYAIAKSDQMTKFKISLPESALASSQPSRIQFYSNCAQLVFEDEIIEGARLARGSVQVWCQLLPTSSTLGSVQITCVSEKKQLVYGWVVQVYPYSAKIS